MTEIKRKLKLWTERDTHNLQHAIQLYRNDYQAIQEQYFRDMTIKQIKNKVYYLSITKQLTQKKPTAFTQVSLENDSLTVDNQQLINQLQDILNQNI